MRGSICRQWPQSMQKLCWSLNQVSWGGLIEKNITLEPTGQRSFDSDLRPSVSSIWAQGDWKIGGKRSPFIPGVQKTVSVVCFVRRKKYFSSKKPFRLNGSIEWVEKKIKKDPRKKEKICSASEDRTPISHVTGGYTDHYTNAESVESRCLCGD